MARWNVDHIVGVSDDLWSKRSNYDALLAECYEMALPDRNPYHNSQGGRPQGQAKVQGTDKSSRRVMDSTLQVDAMKLANRLQYELFPIGMHWADLEAGPFVDGKAKQQAKQDLYSLQQVLFMAIQFSNFDLAIAEWLLELVVAGTACMLVTQGDDDNPIIYQTVSQAFVAFRSGAFGFIDFVSRKHKMRHSQVLKNWPDAREPKKPQSADGKENDPEIDLIDVCYYDLDDKDWKYDVIVTGGAETDDNEKILERDYMLSPWVIARWTKAAEEDRGRSLVMAALPDARVLSAVKNYLLRHAALAIGGVYLANSNEGTLNVNNIRIFPGAVIPVRRTGGTNGASIAPLAVGGDLQLTDLVIKDLINSIHQIMMNDGLPEISDGVRTATELIERMKELQQSLGAPFARIWREGVIPMLEASIAHLARLGVIPIDPETPMRLNSGQVQLKAASPLLQGQSIREVEVAQQAMAITGDLAGEQMVQLGFKVEEFGPWVGGKLGMVPELIRSSTERQQLQGQVGQIIAAQQQGAPIPGAVGGTGGVAPPTAANQQQEAQPLAA